MTKLLVLQLNFRNHFSVKAAITLVPGQLVGESKIEVFKGKDFMNLMEQEVLVTIFLEIRIGRILGTNDGKVCRVSHFIYN